MTAWNLPNNRLSILSDGALSGRCRCPTLPGVVQPENGEACQVARRCKQTEVGGHFGPTSDRGSLASVLGNHEMAKLALHLGPDNPVVLRPLRCLGDNDWPAQPHLGRSRRLPRPELCRVVAGIRIPASVILDCLVKGMSEADIAAEIDFAPVLPPSWA